MSRYYSYETIKDNAKDVTLENGVKHRCIDPDALLDIEPADVRENVRGEWKKRKDKPLQNWYQCSNCGAICGETPKYCSECGADMRGEA